MISNRMVVTIESDRKSLATLKCRAMITRRFRFAQAIERCQTTNIEPADYGGMPLATSTALHEDRSEREPLTLLTNRPARGRQATRPTR